MTPTSKAFALEFMERGYEVWLIDDPFSKLLDALFASAIASNYERVTPFGFAVNPHVIVIFLEVDHCGAGRRPFE